MAIMKASMILVLVLGIANLCAARRVKVASKRIESKMEKASAKQETAHVNDVAKDISAENTSLTTADSQEWIPGSEYLGSAVDVVKQVPGLAVDLVKRGGHTLLGTGLAHLTGGSEHHCLSTHDKTQFCWHAPLGDFRLRVVCGDDFVNGTCDEQGYDRCDKENWWLTGVRMAAKSDECHDDPDEVRNAAFWSIVQHNGICDVLKEAFHEVKTTQKEGIEAAMVIKIKVESIIDEDPEALTTRIAGLISGVLAPKVSELVVPIIQNLILDEWASHMMAKLKEFADGVPDFELVGESYGTTQDGSISSKAVKEALMQKIEIASDTAKKEIMKQWNEMEAKMHEHLPTLLKPILFPVVESLIASADKVRDIIKEGIETEAGQLLQHKTNLLLTGIDHASAALKQNC